MLKQELAAAGVRQLRDIARSVGITMPQKLRKEELIDEIVAQMQKLGRTDLPQIIPMKKRGQKSKQEREALAAQQAAMQQKNQDEPPQTSIPSRNMQAVPSQTLVQNGFEPRHYDTRVADAGRMNMQNRYHSNSAQRKEQQPVRQQNASYGRYERPQPQQRYASPAQQSYYAPRQMQRQQPRAKYASSVEDWGRPQGNAGDVSRKKTPQDPYAVMAQRYADTLALHRSQNTMAPANDMEDDDMTFVAPRVEAEEAPRMDMDMMPQEEAVGGVLEILPDGYGFIRVNNYSPGVQDAYVSLAQIRRLGLRAGDYLYGTAAAVRPREKRRAMQSIESVNGVSIMSDMSEPIMRPCFDELVPIYPNERLHLSDAQGQDVSLRLIDLLAPVGMGQRGLIVAPPKTGKTTLLQRMAASIKRNHPDVHVMMLLIDERPEEVTDMQRSVDGEVVYSTFDEQPDRHVRVAELFIERAKRLVEQGTNVVVLLDSITRLARAYNLTAPSGGKILSGGLDSAALYKPKWFFGAARNIEGGASLTILATALVDTGSRLDDVIYEEFKGTGNMEVFLDRKLSQRRIFPALDLLQSGTRHEELLLDAQELSCVWEIRRLLSGAGDATETLIDMISKTRDNQTFFKRFADWRQLMTNAGTATK